MATRIAPEPSRHPASAVLEPVFYPTAGLWLHGNTRLLERALTSSPMALGRPVHSSADLDRIEQETERAVLEGKVFVSGIHNPAHQRAAIVPLRWGAPRILVLSGGFHHHLGSELKEEPFRAARLWRYQFDEQTDLVVSKRAPDKLPTYAQFNPTVDRLIERIISRTIPGLFPEKT